MPTEITRYAAADGTEFPSLAEAEEYEAAAADLVQVKAWLDSLPTEGDDAVSSRARTRMLGDVMRFLEWERIGSHEAGAPGAHVKAVG